METLKSIWSYIRSIKYLWSLRYWALVILIGIPIASFIDSFLICMLILMSINACILLGLEKYDNRKKK
jgi:hypothetical protein